MFLAAGFGTRLAPLTDGRAKAVVPFLNRPLLDYTLDWLRRCGFREVLINLHHLPDTVRDVYRGRAAGMALHFSVEERILGTAGGPRKVLDRLGERVLLVNGDIAATLSPGALWRHHRDAGALATMALHDGSSARGYPGIHVDERGAVTHIPGIDAGVAPPETPAAGCFSGVHIVEREVIELAPEEAFCGMVDPLYAELLRRGLPLHAQVLPGSWYEIGTPERYVAGQLEALRREDFALAFEGCRRHAPRGWLRGLVGAARAGLEPPYFIDRGAQLGEGALLQNVVVGTRACVGPGATVLDSVLLERAWVGAGARLERCLVLEGAEVPAGGRLEGEVVAPAPVARAR
jgi:NDP-sugar pyrophosphorylase family protein